jgi:kynureninase
MTFENTKEFARQLDSEDKLNKYRDEFIFPKVNDKKSNLFQWKSWACSPRKKLELMSMKWMIGQT